MRLKHATIAMVWALSLVGVGLWAQAPGSGVLPRTFDVDRTAVRQATPSQAAATVTGSVHDTQGDPIPGVTVVLIDDNSGARGVPVVTDVRGVFAVSNVAPSTYTVEVSMPGFRTLRRAGVFVNGGTRNTGVLVVETLGQFSAGRPTPRVNTAGALITGDDIAFQPVNGANTPPGTIAGRWMVRVNGTWYQASGVTQIVPAR